MSCPGAAVARSALLDRVRLAETEEVAASTWSVFVPSPEEAAVTETTQAGEEPLMEAAGVTFRVHVLTAPGARPEIVYTRTRHRDRPVRRRSSRYRIV
jgi:hypothetical protein